MTNQQQQSLFNQRPQVIYAGNPPLGLFGWVTTVVVCGFVGIFFTLDYLNVKKFLNEQLINYFDYFYFWSATAAVVIVTIRIFTVIFPPRAYALWFDRTDIGKFGRKFARNWRKIIVGLAPTSSGLEVRRHFPGLVKVYKENGKLILLTNLPSERPSGSGLKEYSESIAKAFLDSHHFAAVEVVDENPGKIFNKTKIAIIPTDLTEEVRKK